MTAEPTGMARMATPRAFFQAHPDTFLPARETPRVAWRLSELALLGAALWLLLALVVTAAGEGLFGMLFAGTALLWVVLSAVEAYESHERAATLRAHGQVRRQAMPSRG